MKKWTAADIESLRASWAWRITKPLYKIEREIQRWQRRRRQGKVAAQPVRPELVSADFERLKAGYFASPLATEPDNFVLYRILGNDLEPRHRKGQTRSNLGLILAHEPPLEGCEKRWIVNRIVDPEEEGLILDLLEHSGQPYTRIPFDLETYGRIGWEGRGFSEEGFFLSEAFRQLSGDLKARAEVHARTAKNLYVMNNNGGRNAALQDGRSVAKWILPWDGNCFLTQSAWAEIRAAVTAQPYLKYFTVPMLRVANNEDLLRDRATHPAIDEPQLIFRRDAAEIFDEAFPYGRRPKVEMLLRLGVPGPWSGWSSDPWDLPAPAPSAEAGQFAEAGWVGRLESGRADLEKGGNGAVLRGLSRSDAIVTALDALDAKAILCRYRPEDIALYDGTRIGQLRDGGPDDILQALKADAEAALRRGPYSVTDKPDLPPSGNRHDYLSLARYWWPDPASPDGRPYVRQDGKDIFAASLPEFRADRFDRDRLQNFADDTILLALAGTACRDSRYLDHAAQLVRTWFLDPRTRMTPHLRFAQIARGHNGDENKGSGVLDLACIAPLLDAVRLIEGFGALDPAERSSFRNWLRAYLDWLHASPQGRAECRARNNHGTFFDVQCLAIAAFLGDGAELAATLRRARERIPHQFAADGSQPHEIARTRPRHYSHYNLVAWTTLARLAESVGDDLWSYRTADGRGIERGLAWLLGQSAAGGHPGSEADVAPLAPHWFVFRSRYTDSGMLPTASDEVAPFRLDPLSGVPPYWQLLR
jgi:hypothetical protein